jgi:TfoX/Sxy family transcriptional regulator of competence genes
MRGTLVPWKKAPPALVAAFDAALPDDPAVERRQMFGYPCAFARGHMFTGLHEHRCVVRLGEQRRAALLATPGAKPFVALGRTMREYVVVPPGVARDRRALARCMRDALAYVLALPPKAVKSPRRKRGPTRPGRS